MASWYGAYFHGLATASGEIFDMEAFTGAHRTLPLGTVVRVTNVLNGEGAQGVFWFEPEDAQSLMSDILTDSLEKLLTTTKVENNLLRLK